MSVQNFVCTCWTFNLQFHRLVIDLYVKAGLSDACEGSVCHPKRERKDLYVLFSSLRLTPIFEIVYNVTDTVTLYSSVMHTFLPLSNRQI